MKTIIMVAITIFIICIGIVSIVKIRPNARTFEVKGDAIRRLYPKKINEAE